MPTANLPHSIAMIPQTIVTLAQPVTLDLRISHDRQPRPRVAPPTGDPAPADPAEHIPELHTFSEFPLHVHFDGYQRTISAWLAPLPTALLLYGPEDFQAAAADTTDDHAARVLQLLGSTPADVLQPLIDGTDMPPRPARVPREIPNWRAKVILAGMGLLPSVEAAIAALPEPDRTVATLAWGGDAKLARRGKTVLGLSAALGLTSDQIDLLFIAADALEV